MATTTSYDLKNTIRDLTTAFEILKKNNPTVLSLFQSGKTAKHTKHEWFNQVLEPVHDAINMGGGFGHGVTGLVVDDDTKFEVGDLLTFQDANYEIVKVTAINASTHTLTVTRGFGGTTDSDHADNTVIVRISNPQVEASDPTYGSVALADVLYNYTQIFRKDVKISNTAISVGLYETNDLVNKAVQQKLTDFYYDLNNSAIFGARYQGSSASDIRTAGGLLWWLTQSDAINSDASGATVTYTMINDLIESIVKAGGKPNTLAMGTVQARKVSALLTSYPATFRTISADSRNAGGYVQTFTSDLPMGIITDVLVDMNIPDDKIFVLDKSKLYLVPLKNRAVKDFDTTEAKTDAITREILGEYTFEIVNPNNAHGLLYNLG